MNRINFLFVLKHAGYALLQCYYSNELERMDEYLNIEIGSSFAVVPQKYNKPIC